MPDTSVMSLNKPNSQKALPDNGYAALLMKQLLKRGAILHSDIFEEIGHGKFFVIIGEDENGYVGFFFINSGISEFVAKKPKLAELQYSVSSKDYTFLSYDSFVGCHDIKPISKAKLISSINAKKTTVKGKLTPNDLVAIIIITANSS
ncbi:hypothetical protein Barb6XT_01570 [Bacteroidales bacterium Barb6XT]|nr:hypothetical protein Barb6XT_01570 [Bacteroidales bacterium Barb6XT]